MADDTTRAQEQPEGRKIRLSPDQFTVNEKGELVIKNVELVQALLNAQAAGESPERGISGGIIISD